MARIFIDGFESGGGELWSDGNALIVSSSGLSMDGNYCLKVGTGEWRKKILDVNYGSLYFAFLYHPWDVSAKAIIPFYDSAGVNILSLLRNTASYFIEIRRGSHTGTLLVTGNKTLNLNTTYLIEVYFKPLNTGGECTVKIDGAVCATYTGDTTEGLEEIRSFQFGPFGLYTYAHFDNLVVDDAAWIGNTRIQAVVPTGVGASTQWTPSAGANWECVDEKPPSDADYISTNVTNNLDLYTMSDLSGIIESVKCVQVQARCAYEGAPTPTHIQLACRSGGANYFSADQSPPVSFGMPVCKIWETDPATGAAWIKAGVDAAEFGVKATA